MRQRKTLDAETVKRMKTGGMKVTIISKKTQIFHVTIHHFQIHKKSPHLKSEGKQRNNLDSAILSDNEFLDFCSLSDS